MIIDEEQNSKRNNKHIIIYTESNSSERLDSPTNKKKRRGKEIKKDDDLIFGGRFECKKTTLLGSGTFGEIYLGIDTIQKEYVAVKLEKPTAKDPQLRNEKVILDMMTDIDGFPNVFDFGPYLESTYMAMELLGPSTNSLFQHQKHKFTLQTVLLLGYQMIERLQELHNKNFIHRDIKPENFTMGIGAKSNTLYMIDFGLCKKYKDTKTMEHIIYRETREITGTPRYASINNHLGIEQSRRDDLEGIAYVLIYFMKRRLPWQNVEGKTSKERYKKILEKKLSIPTELLCKDIPVEFGLLLNYSRGLRYDERPDYNFLKGMLSNLLFDLYFEDFIYDWTLDNPGTEAPNRKPKEQSAPLKKKRTGLSLVSNEMQNGVKSTAIFGGDTVKEIIQKKHLYQKESNNDLLKLSSSINDSSAGNSSFRGKNKKKSYHSSGSDEDDNDDEDKADNSDSRTEEIDENEILEMEAMTLNDLGNKNKNNSNIKKEEKTKPTLTEVNLIKDMDVKEKPFKLNFINNLFKAKKQNNTKEDVLGNIIEEQDDEK